MSEGVFTIESDGLLAVEKHKGQLSAALDEILSTFAEPVHTTAFRSHYRITSASIWKARRQGLSLDDITHALETYGETDIPTNLLDDVELWSQQIDRLWLETNEGRLVLRSQNPRLISAILRQRMLRRFIKQKVDVNSLELRVDMEPDLMQAFDDAQYPILDRRREANAVSAPHEARSAANPTGRRRKRQKGPQNRQSLEVEVPKLTAPLPPSRASVRTDDFFDVFGSQLAPRCQARTRTGRQCRNRAQPSAVYCRIHMKLAPLEPDATQIAFSQDTFRQMLDIDSITIVQMALFRVGMNVALGLITWLLNTLFMWIGTGWLGLPLASWYIAPIAFLFTCWLVSKFVFRVSLKAIMLLLFFFNLSMLMDCFNKEGLILNICFVLIPFVLPLYLLYQHSLSGWWALLFIPVGLYGGRAFYHILDDASESSRRGAP